MLSSSAASDDLSVEDASLLAASRNGDVVAFGKLVERYHNLVAAIAYSRTGDRTISEDIAQETFLVAWADVSRVRDPNKLRAWLCGIARNLAGKTLRRRRREEITDDAELDARAARDSGPLSALIDKQTEASVWSALEQLPPAYREPLVLFYRENQSIKQVADGLGLSEETAKQRLSRGRVSLKANLELVEQTVTASRPRKGAVAAVLAALALMSKSTQAVAATKPIAWKLAAASMLAAAAIGAGMVVVRSQRASRAEHHDSDLIAQLKQARDAARAKQGATRGCELRGTVTRDGGVPAAGVLVASTAHRWDATTLEPRFTETDAQGRWKLAAPPGPSTISVSSAGQRAQSRVVTCAEPSVDEQRFVLDTAGSTLRGSVTDVGGGAIAGATIWFMQPQMPDAIFVTRSDAGGAYELRVHPGAYVIMMRHAEYTIDVRPVAIGDAPAREDFALLPAASIEGVVVDSTGAPVPAAKILFAPDADSPWSLAAAYAGLLPHAADASGRFVVRGLPPGGVKLSARTAALATAQPTAVDVELAEAKTGITLTTSAARTISGFVVARDGRAGLAGVQVVAMRDQLPITLPVVTATDHTGYFELGGLTAGSYRISANGAGYVPYVAEQPIVIADRDIADVLVRVEHGVALRGRIDPPGPATLKLQPASSTDAVAWTRAALARADVDERGNFAFAAVAPGRYVISATTYDRAGELPVTVSTTDTTDVRVVLEPRPTITGVVVDDAGKPLAGALIEATATPADPLYGLAPPVRTDERGAFKIIAQPGARYRARVFDARGQRPWADDKRPFKARPLTPGTNEKLVVASGGGRISGVVLGAGNQPVSDAWIEVNARDARDYPSLYRRAPIATDAAGRFTVEGLFGSELVVEATKGRLRATAAAPVGSDIKLELAAQSMLIGEVTGTPELDVVLRSKHAKRSRRDRVTGSFRLAAMPGDYELVVTARTGYVKRELTIGATPTRIDVVLTPWASVRGKVVGSDGKPWVNASISVHEYADLSTLTKTDSAGSFTLDRMIAGRNTIRISNGGIRQLTSVEIDLAPGQQLDLETIEGRTLDPDSDDVGAIVRALEPQTTASTSVDLGLQFFVAVAPPSAAKLAQVARDPLLAYRERSDDKAMLWIVAVTPDGPGARAGLRSGDRVIAVGTRKTGTGQAAAEAGMSLSTRWRSRGRPVRWTVMRDGHELAVDVLVPD